MPVPYDDIKKQPPVSPIVSSGLQVPKPPIPSIEASDNQQQAQVSLARNATSAAANIPAPVAVNPVLPTPQAKVGSGIGMFGNADPQKHAVAESVAQGVKDAVSNPINSAGRAAGATVDAVKYIGETMGEGAAAAGIDTANALSRAGNKFSEGFNGGSPITPPAAPAIIPPAQATAPTEKPTVPVVPVVTPVNPNLQDIPAVEALKTGGGVEQPSTAVDVGSKQQVNKQLLLNGTTSYYGGDTAPNAPRTSINPQSAQQQTEQPMTISGQAVNGMGVPTGTQSPQLNTGTGAGGMNYSVPNTQSARGGSTPQERYAIQQAQLNTPAQPVQQQRQVIETIEQSAPPQLIPMQRVTGMQSAMNNKYANQKNESAIAAYNGVSTAQQKAIDSVRDTSLAGQKLGEEQRQANMKDYQDTLNSDRAQTALERGYSAASATAAREQANKDRDYELKANEPTDYKSINADGEQRTITRSKPQQKQYEYDYTQWQQARTKFANDPEKLKQIDDRAESLGMR